MNKKLIDRHSIEIDDLNEKLKSTRSDLYETRGKLEKYKEIAGDFKEQMEMFEQFQRSSNTEIARLKAVIEK